MSKNNLRDIMVFMKKRSVFQLNTFTRHSVALFVGTMLGNILNYVFHLVIGRMVSVTMYGEIESLIALIAIASVPAAVLNFTATKFSAQLFAQNNHTGTRQLIRYLNSIVLRYGFVLFVFLLVITPLVRDFLKLDSVMPIVLLWIGLFASFFVSIVSGVLSGWQKFRDVGLLTAYGAGIKFVLSVIFILIGFGVNGVIGSVMLATVLSYGIAQFILRFLSTSVEHQSSHKSFDIGDLKKYLIPVLFGTLSITILSNVDMLFAKNALDAQAAGQYGALTVVSKIIFFATGVIATVLFSMSSKSTDMKESLRTFRNAALMMVFVTGCSIIMYFLFPELILSLLFGSKYISIAHYLGWFGILASAYSFLNLVLQYLLSLHATRAMIMLFVLSLSSIVGLVFFGQSIRGILTTMIVVQVAAIFVGLYFIFHAYKQFTQL